MSLFTNAADSDLPLLTWAFQVSSDNRDELLAFLKRWPREYAALSIDEGLGVATTQRMSGPQLDKIDELGEMCRLAHNIMESLYDGSEVTHEHLNTLNTRLTRYQFYFTEPAHLRQHSVDIGLLVPSVRATDPHSKAGLPPFQPAGEILAELYLLVLRATAGVSPLLRCDECQSVFYATRGGQRFCSYRCGNRYTVRESRASKKSK